eukprot:scaffold27966_cov64-Phaeocystis_antarctica.AAC.11
MVVVKIILHAARERERATRRRREASRGQLRCEVPVADELTCTVKGSTRAQAIEQPLFTVHAAGALHLSGPAGSPWASGRASEAVGGREGGCEQGRFDPASATVVQQDVAVLEAAEAGVVALLVAHTTWRSEAHPQRGGQRGERRVEHKPQPIRGVAERGARRVLERRRGVGVLLLGALQAHRPLPTAGLAAVDHVPHRRGRHARAHATRNRPWRGGGGRSGGRGGGRSGGCGGGGGGRIKLRRFVHLAVQLQCARRGHRAVVRAGQ